jgi:hypothetical protein
MADTYPYATQRAQLERFLKAIGARPSTLRKDGCGDPAIMGSRGHVIAIPGIPSHRPRVHEAHKREGFLLYVVTESGTACKSNAERLMTFSTSAAGRCPRASDWSTSLGRDAST